MTFTSTCSHMKARVYNRMGPLMLLLAVLLVGNVQIQSFADREVQGFAPPDSLEQLFSLSDCVVLVEMNQGVERSYQISGSPGPNVRTEFAPRTLEMFKHDGRTCGTAAMRVLHQTVVKGVVVDGRLIRTEGRRPFADHEHYVLFLTWHAAYQAYDFMFGSAAAYRIHARRVSVDDSHALSRSWSGRNSADLLTALRTLR